MFGVTEWLVIAVILLVLFGASRIPAIGAGMGKGIRNFLDAVKGDTDKTPAVNEGKEVE